jgi:putative transposase
VRHRNRRLRTKLQRKGTKSARRLLCKRRLRERRFAHRHQPLHPKQLVAEAERTGRGIALEDLEGIRERVRLRKPQRATLHSWAFHQLGQFVAYKAQRAGVPVAYVDPAHTSQTCSECGHLARCNRDRPGPILLRVLRLR